MRSKLIVVLVFLMILPALAADTAKEVEKSKKIESWLMLGPGPVTGLERAVYDSNRDIANHRFLNISDLSPRAGEKILWSQSQVLTWTLITRFSTKAESDSLYYFVTFPDAKKFLKTRLVINGVREAMVNLYLDGKEVKKEYDQKKEKV
ncbi:MAG: hypothetical protein KAT17_06740, partial [Candidatus Aminicenantes bacterium]|nr:hypothetical protein [Candidatus Aminicenantes bacterium]